MSILQINPRTVFLMYPSKITQKDFCKFINEGNFPNPTKTNLVEYFPPKYDFDRLAGGLVQVGTEYKPVMIQQTTSDYKRSEIILEAGIAAGFDKNELLLAMSSYGIIL